jgi:hypothetical protein
MRTARSWCPPTDGAALVEGGMTHGVLSMDSFGFGLPEGIALRQVA